ncbi:early transcribed membrane protein 8 [Plasmodium sp. gorilla clade G2]|uniref:early transcribed membrane protein 8 n=1 Tax=Plasmodium sp. gorilla clade G2 TaxID=880535 RepID=UPI000D21306C|nr:early transcribed membrane protein 8 [Plasmodium sp. gorilla clade G2]SOV13843.1 early transcribed membrane protein 8 [Plasmodium sp. gorilla clade G2]
MKVSIFFSFAIFLFVLNLFSPCMCKKDFAKEWVKDKLSIVNLKLDKYDKKKKMALISGAAIGALALISLIGGGIYLTQATKSSIWNNSELNDTLYDIVMETVNQGNTDVKLAFHRGVKLDNAVPTEETFKKYIKQNIKDRNLNLSWQQERELYSLIPYIRFNVERLAIFLR